jgi:anti-sigma regulatory factor (Ser/Thr protein kinase)
MAKFIVPTNATIHAARNFIAKNDFFSLTTPTAELEFRPDWMYSEPFAVAMIAAWAEWCKANSLEIRLQNLTKKADYLWRMGLFNHLPFEYPTSRLEHEEAGRFMPIKRVVTNQDVRAAVADISALLHLADNPEDLAAVRFCVSELIRNALEHSGSPLGAFVCAQNYSKAKPPRVSIGIADCGIGVSAHLSRVYTQARDNDVAALQLALEPGVTGALPGMYGQSDNAGAGLFFTRSIAKGTGGYFLIYSGSACYRIKRTKPDDQVLLFPDSFKEPHNLWMFDNRWQGTVVAIEIRTDRIPDFGEYLTWIRQQMPKGERSSRRLRFT